MHSYSTNVTTFQIYLPCDQCTRALFGMYIILQQAEYVLQNYPQRNKKRIKFRGYLTANVNRETVDSNRNLDSHLREHWSAALAVELSSSLRTVCSFKPILSTRIFLRRFNAVCEDLQCFDPISESFSQKNEEKISMKNVNSFGQR